MMTETLRLIAGVAAGSVVFLLAAGALALTGPIESRTTPHAARGWQFVRFTLLLGVMSSIEEVIFRAGVLGLGETVIGFPAALAASMLLFAAAHRTAGPLTRWAWVNLGLVGLLLGILYQGWGLAAAIGFHWGWNQWEWQLGFRVSGERTSRQLPAPGTTRILPRYPYGPEAHPIAAAFLAAAVVLVLWAVHGKGPGPFGAGPVGF